MRSRFTVTILFGSITIIMGLWLVMSSPKAIEEYAEVTVEPRISPDYSDIVIPTNIAPINFRILEQGQLYFAKIHADDGEETIDIFSKTGEVRIPLRKWRALLKSSKGNKIFFDVYVKNAEHEWRKFQSITNIIAEDDVDSYVVYRRMKPIYNWWKGIGIYQRNLVNYNESLVMHGRSFEEGCLNCHSFVGNDPDTMTIGLRSAVYGSSTLLARDGTVKKIGSKWGYTAWHPSGTLAVYSINKVRQFFHTGRIEVRDVVDLDSALVCYMVEDRKAVCPPQLSDKNRLETYPTWSPDGKYLYYCSAPVLWKNHDTVPPENYEKLKYDLCRVSFDVRSNSWGQVETVLSAEETGLSILLPRISPDGRFLLFCMCEYGCFPVYQSSSDLYIMDLSTGEYRKVAVNSKYSESWHSWSSNSRWIAFSSKRQDGLFTRTYLSYVDNDGKLYKPFVLPQRDPIYYDSLLETYSVPELIRGKIRAAKSLLGQAARNENSISVDVPITSATPKVEEFEPWQERE
ncbi:MAG: TolB family protein [Planctomycetota bacterium]